MLIREKWACVKWNEAVGEKPCEIQDPTTPLAEGCEKSSNWCSAEAKWMKKLYTISKWLFFCANRIHCLFITLCLKHCRNRFHIILETSRKRMNWQKDSADTLSLERRQRLRMEPIWWHFSEVFRYSHPFLWAKWNLGVAA